MNLDDLKQQLQSEVNLAPAQAEQAAQLARAFFAVHPPYPVESAPQVSGFFQHTPGADDLTRDLGRYFLGG